MLPLAKLNGDFKSMPPARQVLALILKAHVDVMELHLETSHPAFRILKEVVPDDRPATRERQSLPGAKPRALA